jgi:ceramide glucosyltransferase
MAPRRDLRAMGAMKDVLAEDYVMGRMVSSVLGKRVAVGRRPVENVSERRTLREFAARYRRWGVMQRQAVGPLAYAGGGALLNPILLATGAAALARTPAALAGLAVTCAVKAALDGVALRALRPAGFRPWQLAVVPLKDIVHGSSWAYALARREVYWRGNRLRVHSGTRLEAHPQTVVPSTAARETVARA